MNASVRHVPLNEVAAGDMLAEDVTDAGGRILVSRGAPVTGAILASLRRRGIETIAVAIAEDNAAPDPSTRRAIIEQEMRIRFRRAGHGAASRLLFQATLEHLLERGL